MCRAGGEAFKRRLVHRVALTIMAKNNFVATALKNFIFVYILYSRNVWQRENLAKLASRP